MTYRIARAAEREWADSATVAGLRDAILIDGRDDGPGSARGHSQVPDQGQGGQFTGSFDAVFTVEGIGILASPLAGRHHVR